MTYCTRDRERSQPRKMVVVAEVFENFVCAGSGVDDGPMAIVNDLSLVTAFAITSTCTVVPIECAAIVAVPDVGVL
jgi:hypothetical protein